MNGYKMDKVIDRSNIIILRFRESAIHITLHKLLIAYKFTLNTFTKAMLLTKLLDN